MGSVGDVDPGVSRMATGGPRMPQLTIEDDSTPEPDPLSDPVPVSFRSQLVSHVEGRRSVRKAAIVEGALGFLCDQRLPVENLQDCVDRIEAALRPKNEGETSS